MTPQNNLAAAAPAFRAALAAWYQANRRTLPWREQPSLYRTVVSEFMLQQTQIKTALPYFERWLRQFPDFPSLAAASEEAVLQAWEGLGYYSRARRLHTLARELNCLPSVPTDAASWLAFTGIGPYSAAAITSIAFNHPSACVDGNVVRILARLTGDASPLGNTSAAGKRFQPLADALLDAASPGDHNQAMMELGATLCTRHNPLCTVCPVLSLCAAARAGTQDRIPNLARPATEEIHLDRLWISGPEGLLLHLAPAGGRLQGLAELPDARQVRLKPGVLPSALPLGRIRRSITRFRYIEAVLKLPAEALAEAPVAPLLWIPSTRLAHTPLSGPHRRFLNSQPLP